MFSLAGIAFLPYGFYVLVAARFPQALGTAVATLLLTAVPLVVTDRLFYGKWAVRFLAFSCETSRW